MKGLVAPPLLIDCWGRLNALALYAALEGGETYPPFGGSAAMICSEALNGSAVIPRGHPRFPGVHHQWWNKGGGCHHCCA